MIGFPWYRRCRCGLDTIRLPKPKQKAGSKDPTQSPWPNDLTHKAAGRTEDHATCRRLVADCEVYTPFRWGWTSWVSSIPHCCGCRWAYNRMVRLESRYRQTAYPMLLKLVFHGCLVKTSIRAQMLLTSHNALDRNIMETGRIVSTVT